MINIVITLIFIAGETSYNGMSEVYDITVNRRETEGFGFVIISSVTKSGSVIGEFIGMCHLGKVIVVISIITLIMYSNFHWFKEFQLPKFLYLKGNCYFRSSMGFSILLNH